MLGSAFAEALGTRVVVARREDLDVLDSDAILMFVSRIAPELVINCAADVDVEGAEADPRAAIAGNVHLPELLARACRKSGALLVHFSSTGCYGDWKATPYVENDHTEPTTVHHRAKLAGEAAVRGVGCEHLILRTGWLYGGGPEHKRNFVWHRMVEASRLQTLFSDVEQRGNPTYTGDVASQTLTLVRDGCRGTYNCVSHGDVSRFSYVERIVQAAGLDCTVMPTGAFARRANVSKNEAALNRRLGMIGLDMMPDWTSSLDAYVRRVQAWPEWIGHQGSVNV